MSITREPQTDSISFSINKQTGVVVAKVLWSILIVFFIFIIGYSLFNLIATQNSKIEEKRAALETISDEKMLMLNRIETLEKQLEISASSGAEEVFEFEGLVEVKAIDSSLVVELIYATEQNFTEQKLYTLEVCLLRRGTAEKLAAANAEFAEKGYRLKIWDAYRPKSVQRIMYDKNPNGVYVADPNIGSDHNRGAAVDVTLVDENGKELAMPTGFDDFTEEALRNYSDMDEEARKNMDYLTDVMVRHGFTPIRSEWWHFNDSDVQEYPHLDISFEDWVNEYFSSK